MVGRIAGKDTGHWLRLLGIRGMVESRFVRILLWPLACLYWLAVAVRGWLYDRGWVRAWRAEVPTLVVGNLAVGGTGKSQVARELLQRLSRRGVIVAMLSRGYGRETNGFRLVDATRSVASEVGDEPLMVARSMPGAAVAVCEDRVRGCRGLVASRQGLEAVVLDDAYQHRRLQAKTYLLLTAYGRLYMEDWPLPVGRLRDARSQAQRADAVVVTKCPASLEPAQALRIGERLRLHKRQMLLFATEVQGEPYRLVADGEAVLWGSVDAVVGVAGIANPRPFFDWLAREKQVEGEMALRDHQRFGRSELSRLREWVAAGRTIVTTEKDAVRLQEAARGDGDLLRAVWVAPVAVRWLFDGAEKIEGLLDGLLR